MLKVIFICPILFYSACFANAQNVFIADYQSEADVSLFETKNAADADIIVYKVRYKSDANAEKGLWHIEHYRSLADWKVYWTKYEAEASCKVYFVDYANQAQRNDCYLDLEKSKSSDKDIPKP